MRRVSKKPVVVAIVGLPGSGKSSIAEYLAKLIGAKVISANAIRVALRKQNRGYGQVEIIMEKEALSAIKRRKNIILDSDFSDSKKRRRLERKAGKAAKIVYIRTYANRDITIGRLLNARYTPNDLYGGASTDWRGNNKGAVVALREMWRRTPHHYRWSPQNGGQFVLKKLPIKFLAEIDTGKNWRQKVRQAAKKLKWGGKS
ncbi:MAG: AAA family ATPase [Candidatus Giovannonibacteria bacterium]|nr:MAG: AAA family ATPase [Candidatus Giovannonibacteria bacterium]